MSLQKTETGRMLAGLHDRLGHLTQTLSSIDRTQVPQIGYISSHVAKLQQEVKQKTDKMLQSFMYGDSTAQELPEIKPPKTLSQMGSTAFSNKPPKYDYIRKQSSIRKYGAAVLNQPDYQDIPCISEDDISKGMLNLINQGIIPKDVDLTPAFTRGAPPLQNRRVRLQPSSMKNEKPMINTNIQEPLQVRYDFTAIDTLPSLNYRSEKRTPTVIEFGEQGLQPLQLPSSQINIQEAQQQQLRDYNELMDTFSLHQFIIRKGVTLVQTPEYISYQRTYFFEWDLIQKNIKRLEAMLDKFQVPRAIIDGKKLAARKLLSREEDLLDCIVNKEECRKFITIPRIQFQGPDGQEKATVVIQAFWRMLKARNTYRQLMYLTQKAKIIQSAFKRFLLVKSTRKQIAMRYKNRMETWRQIQDQFKSDWPKISQQKRIEIHCSSLSIDEARRMTMDQFLVRQNLQMSRIFALQDPNTQIIYLSAFEITSEIIGYYSKVLELGEIKDFRSRFTMIYPKEMGTLPPHLSVTKSVLCSPSTLKRIKLQIRQRVAYIVPNIVSQDEVDLAVLLNVPIFGGDPHKSALYSTKSGSKRVFQQAGIPAPPGAYDIYDEKEFMATLTRLIAKHIHVDTWIFKIDNEFQGRGHAFLEVSKMRLVKQFRKQQEISEDDQERLYNFLTGVIHKRVKLALGSLYWNWDQYIQELVRVGGVIEASPLCNQRDTGSSSISFCIDPDGQTKLIGSFDKIEAKKFVTAGYSFPQQNLPNMNMKVFCMSLGTVLYENEIFGHVTCDLVSFPDNSKQAPHPLFWAVDLKCGMADQASILPFFEFLMEGELDSTTGKYYIDAIVSQSKNSKSSSRMSFISNQSQISRRNSRLEQPDLPTKTNEERFFFFIPYMHNPGISKILYKTFFYMCRMQGISFDLEERKGTAFILPDCLQSGVLGLLSMGQSVAQCVNFLNTAIDFISNQGGILPDKAVRHYDDRSDELQFSDVQSMVKILAKKYKKPPRKVIPLSL